MPLGGGHINKVDVFNILSEKLLLEEKPLSQLRLEVFRLVSLLGRHMTSDLNKGENGLELWDENWDMLNGLYEGLAEIESLVMKQTHEANLNQYLKLRSSEQLEEDALDLVRRQNAIRS